VFIEIISHSRSAHYFERQQDGNLVRRNLSTPSSLDYSLSEIMEVFMILLSLKRALVNVRKVTKAIILVLEVSQ